MDEHRRTFLKQVAKHSLTVAGITAAAVVLPHDKQGLKRAWQHAKPTVKSFLPETTLYAQTTGAGTFTLKGTT